MSRWSPVYVPEIETERHVKSNSCTVEIKIKWIIRKPMSYENTYRDDTSLKYVCSQAFITQALVSFKKYMPPPLPYFKVNICTFPVPHFASIFFAYL